ncbi:MAG: hypothetical protein Q4G64_03810, partial [bacterium]|nr:hypothetical protein [bacterium]
MRRTALTSLALAAALALAGCGGSGNGGETTAPAGGDGQTTAPAGGETADPGAGGVVGMPTVTGAFGEQPVLEFPAEPPADLQVETLHEG